jgi:hypothetical protein
VCQEPGICVAVAVPKIDPYGSSNLVCDHSNRRGTDRVFRTICSGSVDRQLGIVERLAKQRLVDNAPVVPVRPLEPRAEQVGITACLRIGDHPRHLAVAGYRIVRSTTGAGLVDGCQVFVLSW